MELSRILKFRNVWIGVAMLWILFFHSGFLFESQPLQTFINIGYGGVDICLFASGIGCYFSLEKDSDILRFLKRRIKRLGPTWICFIIPWLLWRASLSDIPYRAVLGNLLGIQTLVSWEYHFNWYIGGLVVYYLAMPYLKRLTDSCFRIRQDVFTGLILTLATVPFWGDGNTLIILSRFPVLYAGLVCGKLAKQGYTLKMRDYIAAGILTVVGTVLLLTFAKVYSDHLWSWGLCWYPFALIVPGGCLALFLLSEKLDGVKFLRGINRIMETVGIYSFELYLVHVFLYEGLMPGIEERLKIIPNNLLWAATLPVVVCGIYILNRLTALVSRGIKIKKKSG